MVSTGRESSCSSGRPTVSNSFLSAERRSISEDSKWASSAATWASRAARSAAERPVERASELRSDWALALRFAIFSSRTLWKSASNFSSASLMRSASTNSISVYCSEAGTSSETWILVSAKRTTT